MYGVAAVLWHLWLGHSWGDAVAMAVSLGVIVTVGTRWGRLSGSGVAGPVEASLLLAVQVRPSAVQRGGWTGSGAWRWAGVVAC